MSFKCIIRIVWVLVSALVIGLHRSTPAIFSYSPVCFSVQFCRMQVFSITYIDCIVSEMPKIHKANDFVSRR